MKNNYIRFPKISAFKFLRRRRITTIVLVGTITALVVLASLIINLLTYHRYLHELIVEVPSYECKVEEISVGIYGVHEGNAKYYVNTVLSPQLSSDSCSSLSIQTPSSWHYIKVGSNPAYDQKLSYGKNATRYIFTKTWNSIDNEVTEYFEGPLYDKDSAEIRIELLVEVKPYATVPVSMQITDLVDLKIDYTYPEPVDRNPYMLYFEFQSNNHPSVPYFMRSVTLEGTDRSNYYRNQYLLFLYSTFFGLCISIIAQIVIDLITSSEKK